jgi:hypothetical protein
MKIICLVLILCPFFVFSQTGLKEFTVSGKLTGIADGTEIKLIRNGENIEFAKTKIEKGNFFTERKCKRACPLFFIYWRYQAC